MALHLSRMKHPANPSRMIAIFGSEHAAWSHIKKHLLSEPECRVWALIEPILGSELGFDDGRARTRMMRRFEKNIDECQGLYNLYAKRIKLESGEARELDWIYSDLEECLCLGTSGMLIVIESAVVSAFFAGQDMVLTIADGDIASVPVSMRERPMRSGRDRKSRRVLAEARRKRASLKEWSPEEAIYHLIFKKAVKFVRSFHPNPFLEKEGMRCGQYWKLQARLPRLSQLKLKQWQELRRRFNRLTE